jgi:hypothetical protein
LRTFILNILDYFNRFYLGHNHTTKIKITSFKSSTKDNSADLKKLKEKLEVFVKRLEKPYEMMLGYKIEAEDYMEGKKRLSIQKG